MKVRISKWGNSLGLRLPRALAREVGLEAGQTVELSAVAGKLEVRTQTPIPRYRLADLLAGVGPGDAPPSLDWGPDRGAEILPEDAYSRGEITPEDPGEKNNNGSRSR